MTTAKNQPAGVKLRQTFSIAQSWLSEHGFVCKGQDAWRCAQMAGHEGFAGVRFWQQRTGASKRMMFTLDVFGGWSFLRDIDAAFRVKAFKPSFESAQFNVRATQGASDIWWTVWPSTDPEAVGRDVIAVLQEFALPTIACVLDLACLEAAIEAQRIRARSRELDSQYSLAIRNASLAIS